MDFELGSGIRVDTARLIDTRLLVQANSGGGKSWALRRILEQTHGQVQHLIIDPEGEFATLRERHDYVLAARGGGDVPVDPRSAKLLAERLLELGASAVLDIYELPARDRIRFVRYFLEALVDAPKKLWHPALVVVDEAHVYCPQAGEAESAGAVIDLATRGRKRGFCAVLATQRLSKLHKDAAAELNNKLIGRTGLDVDVKRAADELGFGKERWRELRELPEGHFFTFGPALGREVRAIHVGPVFTSHPKAGARLTSAPPPPSAKVRAVLAELADLPAEQEKRERTMEDLQREVLDLRRRLEAQPIREPFEPERVEVEVVKPETVAALAESLKGYHDLIRDGEALAERFRVAVADLEGPVDRLLEALSRVGDTRTSLRVPPLSPPSRPAGRPISIEEALRPAGRSATGPGEKIGKGERAILTALMQHPGGRTKVQVALLTGYTHGGGRFNNLLGAMRSRGWIVDGAGGNLLITDAGAKALGPWTPLPRGRALREHWARELGSGEGKVLEALATIYPRGFSKEDIAYSTGYEAGGGRFNNILGRLRTLDLITGKGEIRLAEELAG